VITCIIRWRGEGAMSVRTRQARARQSAAFPFAAGVVAFGQILGLVFARAEPPLPVSAAVSTVGPADQAGTPAGPPTGTGAIVADPKQIGNPLWTVPLSSLSVTRERPIFSPGRRPPPPPAVAVPYVPPAPPPKPPEPDHPSLTLLGTLAGDSKGVGIFVNEADKTTLRLGTGDDHEGWVLRSVNGREVTFERGGRTATLALPLLGSPAQSAASLIALGNKWRDGDGQMIRPPGKHEQTTASQAATPQRSMWLDGDGQLITPPSKRGSSPPAVAPTSSEPAM
jgi:hypothetical protein